MKNVIVVSVDKHRYAIELRWIREIITLSYVTMTPGAPACIGGVFNLRGAIIPVLRIGALLDPSAEPQANPRMGDPAILLAVDSIVAALNVDSIEEVSSLEEKKDGNLADSQGRLVHPLDPVSLFQRAIEASRAMRDYREVERA